MEVGLTDVCACDSGISSFAVWYFLLYGLLNYVRIPCTSFGMIKAVSMAAML